jgi:hypothetical protein
MISSISTTYTEPKESSGSIRCYRYGGPVFGPFSRVKEFRNGRVQPPGLYAREVVGQIGETTRDSPVLLGCRYPDDLGAGRSDSVGTRPFEGACL